MVGWSVGVFLVSRDYFLHVCMDGSIVCSMCVCGALVIYDQQHLSEQQ